MSLLAQAVLHQWRCRLGEPFATWDAKHLAKEVLQGLAGDVRVTADPIVVTSYNAPNADCLRRQYEGLPNKLRPENLNPGVPWLENYQLDFRCR